MHDCKILPTSSEYHDGSIKPLHPLHNISMSLGCPPNGVSREFPRLCPWPLPATFAGEANSCITTILGPMGTMTQLQDCDLVEPSDIGFDPGISMYCLQHKAQTLETTYVLNIYMMSSGCFMSKKNDGRYCQHVSTNHHAISLRGLRSMTTLGSTTRWNWWVLGRT